MNRDPFIQKSLGPLLIATVLSACGGATNDDIRTLKAECASGSTTACTAVGGTVGPDDSRPSLWPPSIVLGDCETNVPFVFRGLGPFSVYSSDNVHIRVNSPRPIDEAGTTFYFLVTTDLSGVLEIPSVENPYRAVLTVMDSKSRTAESQVSIASKRMGGCPSNPLLNLDMPSTNARVSEIIRFRVSGGNGPATYDLVSLSDPGVARVTKNPDGESFDITALATGSTLITIKSTDGQHVSTVFRVHAP